MGYFPFDRAIRDHWIYKDSQYFHVWAEMLFTARYSEETKTFLHEGELITIEYGEFIFGRISWSERLGISEQRLRTLIKKLEKEEMIVVSKKYRKSTLYLIKNYRLYNQQSNHQETLVQQDFIGHANQQTNVTSTSNQPATNQQLTTKEERKKEIRKEGKEQDIKDIVDSNESDIAFEKFYTSYPKGVGSVRKKTFESWKKVWKSKPDVEEIILGIQRYTRYQIQKGYSICAAQVFLNQERWKDEWTIEEGGNFGKSQQSNKTTGLRSDQKESKYAFLNVNKPSEPIDYSKIDLTNL